jgi:aspartyl-tRNA(Asn)/glutamyl-tRNA(Gln) amidotransferase subunit B
MLVGLNITFVCFQATRLLHDDNTGSHNFKTITPELMDSSCVIQSVAVPLYPATSRPGHWNCFTKKEALFQTIIGMEVHAQLDIPTKLFSAAPRSFSRIPNSCVYPLDLGIPGFLPVLSQAAVHAALLTAAACRCEIQETSRFERKHYFYADLPLGYQITQQRWPLARNGTLVCRKRIIHGKKKAKKTDAKEVLSVGIDRIQIEQDTGKTTTVTRKNSDGATITQSLVDFNRAGCALVEIVFNPDIRSANDAAAVLTTLRDLLKHIGTCDGRMEEGSLRCDLNVLDSSPEFNRGTNRRGKPISRIATTRHRPSRGGEELEFHQTGCFRR